MILHYWQKIHRVLLVLVTILSMLAIGYLWRRYSIIRAPDYVAGKYISSGGYLLVDWCFTEGRPLTSGDWIVFSHEHIFKLGQIISITNMPISTKISQAKAKFIVRTPVRSNYSDVVWLSADAIRGRILMEIMQANN